MNDMFMHCIHVYVSAYESDEIGSVLHLLNVIGILVTTIQFDEKDWIARSNDIT